ncbi:MAG: protein kinase, partial [Bradymonadaceae bacterium]
EDESGRPVVIKVLAIGSSDPNTLERIRNEIRTVSQIRHDNLTDILGMGRIDDGQLFVAMNFVQRETLSKSVAEQRERSREISLAEERTAHGVLTPFNIYLAKDGSVQIQNLGFGRVAARYLHSQGEGPFAESIYIAPEVRHDPANLTPRADIYSLGMITAELLSGGGLPRDVDHARNVAERLTGEFGEGIHRLIAGSLTEDPNTRISSAGEFRMALDNAIDQTDVDLADGLPPDGIPVAPAVEISDRDQGDDDLFDIPSPDDDVKLEPDADSGDERYLVRKDGLDYGPFTKKAVLEQLYDDEIDEHTSVLDRETQQRDELGELEAFREEVEEYIPKREKRRRKEAERRAEIERKVKKGGKF